MRVRSPVPLRPDVNAMRPVERKELYSRGRGGLYRPSRSRGRGGRLRHFLTAPRQPCLFLSVCRRMVGIEREPAVFRPSAGRRGLREVPISCNKTSGHTTWLEVERPQLPAGLLRSPALVDLGGYHGRCLWPRRSVRSGRASQGFRSPHA